MGPGFFKDKVDDWVDQPVDEEELITLVMSGVRQALTRVEHQGSSQYAWE